MKIVNVRLETESFPDTFDGPVYIIFWWHHVAIGHLYVDTQIDSDVLAVLRKNTKGDVFNTIQFFAKDVAISNQVVQAFVRKDHAAFLNEMKRIFQEQTSISILEKAPISVVICTRDRSADLDNCLRSLMSQKCKPFEIIVIDNGISNNSTKSVVERYPEIRYVIESIPGLSTARNKGISMATSAIIAWLDDDVVAHDLWLSNVWQSFQDKTVEAMTGLVLPAALDTASQRIFEEHWSFNRGYIPRLFDRKSYFLRPAPKVWEIGAGANMAFRRSVLDEVGYFDERLGAGTGGCSEDSELWFRMLEKGHRISYNPNAIVFHTHRKTMNELNLQLFSYMRGHTAAALIQHDQNKNLGFKRYVFFDLFRYYLMLSIYGFPKYKSRLSTLRHEILGICSGIRYYYIFTRKTFKGRMNNEKQQ